MELDEYQATAVERAVQSLLRRERLMRIDGYAGSGKTSCLAHIINAVEDEHGSHNVAVVAFTNVAARVLRSKGIPQATTIHKLIKSYIGDDDDGNPLFADKASGRVPVSHVIVDEHSMLGLDLGTDLLAYRRPVVAFGDPMQLPPIDGLSLMDDQRPTADFTLKGFHRAAEGSGITVLANRVRQWRPMYYPPKAAVRILRESLTDNGDVVTITDDPDIELLQAADRVLVYTNKLRRQLNHMLRKVEGLPPTPIAGDQLIGMKRHDAVTNGFVYTVVENTGHSLFMDDGDGGNFYVEYDEDWFLNTSHPSRELEPGQRPYPMDFTRCMTVHKAQGSEWPNVVVMLDSLPRECSVNWLYTAITRAKSKLTLALNEA